jgi:tripartite ATP-independent transporter DctM subunit
MLALALMVVTHFLARRHDYSRIRDKRASLSEIVVALRRAGWALTVPVVIVVGIRYGVFTPTEAGAVTVVYALLIGLLAHREFRVSDLPRILSEASIASGMVMLVITAATAFGYYMTLERIPARAAELLSHATTNPLIMLLLINAFLLIVGMFVESLAALIILTPILVPVITNLGVDPVQFGLIVVLNLALGGLTPPVGGLMYISCSVLNVRIVDYSRAILPLFMAQLFVLLVLTVFPGLITFFPNLLMGPGR